MKKRLFLIALLLAVTVVLTVGCKKTQEVPKYPNSQENESDIVLPEQDLEEQDKNEESNKKETSSKGEDKKENEDNEENEPHISDGKIELPVDRW